MGPIKIRDLIDLAAVDTNDAQGNLTQLYQWRYDYSMTATKAVSALGASLLVAMIVAETQVKKGQPGIWVLAGFAGSGAMLIVGIIMYLRIRSLSRQYIAARTVLAQLVSIRPFISRFNRARP